jgi:enoyl-CoA hydratase/carnithine racemase
LLLRGGAWRSVDAGIVAESATYSTLQAGPEFGAWLARHERKQRDPETADPVRVRRDGDVLHVTLDRPHVRNAFDARTREALLDALAVAAADPAVRVELDGAGPSFCSGGDLDEFGTFDDPATAHVVRVARSAGRALAGIADRVTARVHGACIGAGIELPAFAGRVVAAPGSTFALPEVAMGLVPGAGGTVSVTQRIGRQRTAWLAITGHAIDAETARAWGLVDDVT